MNEPTMPPPADGEVGEPADLVCAGRFLHRPVANDHGLVVLAMGLPYWLEESTAGFGVWVEPAFLSAVQREFALYAEANRNWPPPPVALPATRAPLAWGTPLCWAAVVVGVHLAQTPSVGELVSRGALDGAAVWRHGEWWRLVTSLFFHADLRHVLSNVLIGAFVFTQVVIARGTARGWGELAMASLAANALTAAIHLGDGSTAIGASTAVFAGIGLLTGAAVRAGWGAPQLIRWPAIFGPASAGLILLALLGAGDARTDVIAHGAGFVAGIATGMLPRRRAAS